MSDRLALADSGPIVLRQASCDSADLMQRPGETSKGDAWGSIINWIQRGTER